MFKKIRDRHVYNKNLKAKIDLTKMFINILIETCEEELDLEMIDNAITAINSLKNLPLIFCSANKTLDIIYSNDANFVLIGSIGGYFERRGDEICKSDK